jgi:hypothetical protein
MLQFTLLGPTSCCFIDATSVPRNGLEYTCIRLVPLRARGGAVAPDAGRERGGSGARREWRATAGAPGAIARSRPAAARVGGESEAGGRRERGGSDGGVGERRGGR